MFGLDSFQPAPGCDRKTSLHLFVARRQRRTRYEVTVAGQTRTIARLPGINIELLLISCFQAVHLRYSRMIRFSEAKELIFIVLSVKLFHPPFALRCVYCRQFAVCIRQVGLLRLALKNLCIGALPPTALINVFTCPNFFQKSRPIILYTFKVTNKVNKFPILCFHSVILRFPVCVGTVLNQA